MADLQNALGQALLKAGRISERELQEAEEASRKKEDEAIRLQLEELENRQVKKLLTQLRRLTSVKKFRGCARTLLLLRPDYIGTVGELARSLPKQESLAELLEQVTRLEWLPSLPPEEQETLVRQML